jgi:hypothetical protein
MKHGVHLVNPVAVSEGELTFRHHPQSQETYLCLLQLARVRVSGVVTGYGHSLLSAHSSACLFAEHQKRILTFPTTLTTPTLSTLPNTHYGHRRHHGRCSRSACLPPLPSPPGRVALSDLGLRHSRLLPFPPHPRRSGWLSAIRWRDQRLPNLPHSPHNQSRSALRDRKDNRWPMVST